MSRANKGEAGNGEWTCQEEGLAGAKAQRGENIHQCVDHVVTNYFNHNMVMHRLCTLSNVLYHFSWLNNTHECANASREEFMSILYTFLSR